MVTDEAELMLHQKLVRLYISTRAAKHFQRDIVRGVEGYIVTGSKQVEIGTKLSEYSRKYGIDNTCSSRSTLSKAAVNFSRARVQIEKERGNLLESFGTQVAEPLRAMVIGAPLEDARHLAQRYDRMRQEVEAQVIEVSKRQAKVMDGSGNPYLFSRLEAAQTKLKDLKSNMALLGKEAASGMAAVEAQQQKMTMQRLIAMIESERAYHQKVIQIFDHLEGEPIFKQFGGGGYGGSDNMVTDEAELMLHQKLERLYISTRAAKHFQRDIVRGVEGYIVTGSKQVEIGTKLSEDSRKYGIDNTCTSRSTLSKVAVNFSRARVQIEKERGNLLESFGTQVAEPLRAMVMGAPLEDARHLAQRYDRMRQEAEAQVINVSKRQAKVIDGSGNPDLFSRLEAAETKLKDLKSNMALLGKEAASGMAAVEAQQQKMTMHRLISMIESERAYHQKVIQILDHLEGEMVSERQRIEASPAPAPPPPTMETPTAAPPPPSYEEVNNTSTSPMQNGSNYGMD